MDGLSLLLRLGTVNRRVPEFRTSLCHKPVTDFVEGLRRPSRGWKQPLHPPCCQLPVRACRARFELQFPRLDPGATARRPGRLRGQFSYFCSGVRRSLQTRASIPKNVIVQWLVAPGNGHVIPERASFPYLIQWTPQDQWLFRWPALPPQETSLGRSSSVRRRQVNGGSSEKIQRTTQ
jgi:hypothetical protein